MLWLLLVLHCEKPAVACRITEVLALCIQQEVHWPKVSAFLMKKLHLPAKVIEQLHNSAVPDRRSIHPVAAEQRAVMLVSVHTTHHTPISLLSM